MGKGKILIVDDDRTTLLIVQKALQEIDYDVTTASSGKEAINLCAREKFDLAYTDMVMPRIGGDQLCAEIKKLSPKTEVILISAYPIAVAKRLPEFLKAGGKDVNIRKPIDVNMLCRVTEDIFRNLKTVPSS